jgi:hypothetical protein
LKREAVSVWFFGNIKVEVVFSEEDGWSIIRDRQPFEPYQINFTKKCGKYIPLRHICVRLWGNTKDSVSVRYYCLIMTP